MVKTVLIAGAVLTFAAFFITLLSSIDSADRDGRIAMPGEAALELDSGKYALYYEEAVETSDNEVFEPPDGIKVRVRGLGGASDPEVDLGGLGNQIGTDNRTAESIGSLKVAEDGRYGVVVGPPPRPAVKPAITVGETTSGAFLRALKRSGILALATAALAGLLTLGRRVRQGPPAPTPAPAPYRSAPSPRAPMIPPPPPRFQPRPDPVAKLEELAAQWRSGAITEDEFQRRKAEVLAGL